MGKKEGALPPPTIEELIEELRDQVVYRPWLDGFDWATQMIRTSLSDSGSLIGKRKRTRKSRSFR